MTTQDRAVGEAEPFKGPFSVIENNGHDGGDQIEDADHNIVDVQWLCDRLNAAPAPVVGDARLPKTEKGRFEAEWAARYPGTEGRDWAAAKAAAQVMWDAAWQARAAAPARSTPPQAVHYKDTFSDTIGSAVPATGEARKALTEEERKFIDATRLPTCNYSDSAIRDILHRLRRIIERLQKG
jgi:hypothetical protein